MNFIKRLLFNDHERAWGCKFRLNTCATDICILVKVNVSAIDLKEVKILQEDHLAIFLWEIIFPIVFHRGI